MENLNLDECKDAYADESPYTRENHVSLAWFAERIVDSLRRQGVKSLLSLGVGHSVVFQALMEHCTQSGAQYVIVEGSGAIIEAMRRRVDVPPSVTLVQSWFETFQPNREFDAIEMGFVLEHVTDPELVIRRFSKFLRPGGTLYVGVPNARSLHRRLGYEAGLLPDLYQLSAADIQFGHQRYFDLDGITKLVVDSGLEVCSQEGVYLKPLTTSQLASLNLSPGIVNALLKVGQGLPDMCNAIYVEARRPNI